MWDNVACLLSAFEVPASTILSWVERNTLSSIFFYGEEAPLFFQSETFPVEVYVIDVLHVGGLCSYVRDVVVQKIILSVRILGAALPPPSVEYHPRFLFLFFANQFLAVVRQKKNN